MLHSNKVDYGPMPFKFFHSWLHRDGFDDCIKKAYAKCLLSNLQMPFYEKIKFIKQNIKVWNHHVKSIEVSRKQEVLMRLIDIEEKIDSNIAPDGKKEEHVKLLKERDDIQQLEDMDLVQKARVKWDVEGDENTKIFTRDFETKKTSSYGSRCSFLHRAQNQCFQIVYGLGVSSHDIETLAHDTCAGGSGEKRNMAWIKWENVLASFEKSGLNIGTIHGVEAGLDLKGCNCNGVWYSIISSYSMLHDRNFLPMGTLCRKVDENEGCLLLDRSVNGSWVWNWKRQVSPDNDGIFSVHVTRVHLNSCMLPSLTLCARWWKILARKRLKLFTRYALTGIRDEVVVAQKEVQEKVDLVKNEEE
ncbi:hypothetical protein Tco_1113021 [Tanacetum coccineum]|uniref:RNA-directed DNA polymerase, eukaryota, reverse transcriptase zinc-binding domain protein n=1 Tax=Tanacetum coccineum TaxID=301880 RepID=A0ABQ5ITQ8_9ASTR